MTPFLISALVADGRDSVHVGPVRLAGGMILHRAAA